MKEVIAIIRQDKLLLTEAGLVRSGILGFTTISAEGRGKQKGKRNPNRPIGELQLSHSAGFVPKIMLSIVVEDSDVQKVVKLIMNINHTGENGDGKIFLCPMGESIRIRTGETGTASLV
jgi:nitrogen regulatory protein PII 2